MKISLLAAVGVIGLFSASALHAQTATGNSGTITKTRRSRVIQRDGFQAVPTAPQLQGAAPRALRSGSPLQAINPLAPASYGSGVANARKELNDPYGRPQGIKLVSIEF